MNELSGNFQEIESLMCGRYALYGPSSRHREHFGTQDEFDLPPRYNVAPSQVLPVVRQTADGKRIFTFAKWGLLPQWVKNPGEIVQPINAKSETVAIRPMFRYAFRHSRVLVPADAFFEWQAVAGGKQPYCIRMRDESPLGFAGLLEHWAGPDGDVQTFTVLTTEANALMSPIHDRMPVIIHPDNYAAWLDTSITEVTVLQAMLLPFPDRLLVAYPISRLVNSTQHDVPEIVLPVEAS